MSRKYQLLLSSLLFPAMLISQESSELPASTEIQADTIPGTDVGFQLTLIPGGNFLMGSPETEPNRRPDEGPQFEVAVDSFWIGTYEVSYRNITFLVTSRLIYPPRIPSNGMSMLLPDLVRHMKIQHLGWARTVFRQSA